MDDSSIVALFWQRSEQAISETAAKYGAYCHKISMNILFDEADSDENVNDTYLRAWNSIPPQRPERLSAFLGRLSRNLALNRYKARHAKKRATDEFAVSLSELDDCTPARLNTEDAADIERLSRSISCFLHTQTADIRRAFVCRYFFGESVAQIAQRFGFGESKVKTMLMRTRLRLRDTLIKEGYYEE